MADAEGDARRKFEGQLMAQISQATQGLKHPLSVERLEQIRLFVQMANPEFLPHLPGFLDGQKRRGVRFDMAATYALEGLKESLGKYRAPDSLQGTQYPEAIELARAHLPPVQQPPKKPWYLRIFRRK
ncbi:MAG: hypothetical protein HY544_03880 [Candidatus Diapherotrites archaeon]|uniref:Uncharacterized protein n=1 Tax=Candidatus Iainarchaeum sp. TaxID=3101447 RepID=A0A8T3YLR6_9ARCH|nr:hypothetical protein [Candidatus Diapherotrites archaeon]